MLKCECTNIVISFANSDKICQCVSSRNIFIIENKEKNLLYAVFDPHYYSTDFLIAVG